jgi:uncharacterized protein with PQ loop repeat
MDTQFLTMIAGTASSLIFVSSNLPMLWKAFTTKNLASYSLGHLGLSNGGNLLFWIYVASLPMGPIWLLHSFNTVVAVLMLIWYLRYERV